MFSPAELRDLAARAATIDERPAGGVVPCAPDDASERLARQHLAAWRESAAAGSVPLFAKRLRQAGHDESSILPWLGQVRLADSAPLPRWTEEFALAAAAMQRPTPPPADWVSVGDEPIPFGELLWPAARATWRGFWAGLDDPAARRLLTAPARQGLQRGLLGRLVGACGAALFGDFTLFRHLEGRAVTGFAMPFWSPKSRVLYDAYLGSWRRGRGRRLFAAKPVAARMLGTTIAHWLDATAEMVDRLRRDTPALRTAFAGPARLGPVTGIEPDLSDPHRQGRSVAILGFAGGTRIVYKPKDLHMDAAWAELLRWLGERGLPLPVEAPRVVLRDGYGWAAFVAAHGAEGDHDEAYSRRAGGLLALLHLLRGTDFHCENIIGNSGGPVPVDLETLLTPDFSDAVVIGNKDPAAAAAQRMLARSVLATHYLPLWAGTPGLRAIQVGGLGPLPGTADVYSRYRYANTDAMALRDLGAEPPPPSLPAAPVPIIDHAEALVAGFSEQYAFLAAQRDTLLADDGPLQHFGDVRLRCLLDSTMAYALVAQDAAAYQHLDDGVAWSLRFELLCRRPLSEEVSPQRWRILAAERRALTSLDIPVFTVRSDAEIIETCSGDRIGECLDGTPHEQIRSRVRGLDKADLALQQRLIHTAVTAQRPGHAGITTAGDDGLTGAARHLGNILAAEAVTIDGSAAWVGIMPVDHEHGNLAVVDAGLYAGTTGIAVFLAALARVTGERRFRDLALAATAPARRIRKAADGGARLARVLGIGAGSGIGSLIYGLVRVASTLGEPRLLCDAATLADLIDEECRTADRTGDVIDGGAGAILALLALYRATDAAAILERAAACGRHLLSSGAVDWDGSRGRPPLLSGFSHGAAGIALALLRLHSKTGDAAFAAAAAAALSRERKLFLPEQRNWAVFPEVADMAPACQWCHGAAGIGLARLGCGGLTEDAYIAGEVETALETTSAVSSLASDHLCCGNFGRFEFLLTAGLQLDRPALVALARDRAAERAAQATANGGFVWQIGDDRLNPSLFRGIAGIGYQLLRLQEPAALPSVLLWD